jgi:23S rRNA (uridine2552-2'-O)-methyltransferase
MTDDDTPPKPQKTRSGFSQDTTRKRMVKGPTRGGEHGRGESVKVKTSKRRTMSSNSWLARQLNDPFVTLAKAKGYRARAAFKLTEIDDRFHLIHKGTRVVDLGCAPGGWLQVCVERGAGDIAGVDLLAIDPVPPAYILQMDFTDPACGDLLLAHLGGPPDLILSDMAPNTTGHRETDHLRIVGLIDAAIDFTLWSLKPGGSFVAKAFQGAGTSEVLERLKIHFAKVQHVKPKASRQDSSELFLVATGFKGR